MTAQRVRLIGEARTSSVEADVAVSCGNSGGLGGRELSFFY